jgi:hypothetical protein
MNQKPINLDKKRKEKQAQQNPPDLGVNVADNAKTADTLTPKPKE